MTRARAVFLAASFAAAPALAAPPSKPATAASKAVCLAAHEEALALKTDKKPHAAHEKLVVCARTECPMIVRKECTDQLDVVQAMAPTVVVEALGDTGSSDTAVTVTLDGKVVAEKLTGAAIDVEPGEHSFVFERASDGKRLEEKVLVVEGEKNRKVVADYQTLLPKRPPPGPAPAAEPKRVPVVAYVAGAVALAGFGSFAFFSITGRSKESDLADGCRPNCTKDDVAPVKQSYLIGDVSLSVGILASVAALVLALPALTSSPPRTAARLAPAPWLPRVRARSPWGAPELR